MIVNSIKTSSVNRSKTFTSRNSVDQMSKSHLMNVPQPLIICMGDYLQDQRVVNGNKTIYRVVDDLAD